ncbi:MAG: hypothetical protein ABL959_01295 [Pyrinomonadaceae bacterium]
MSKLTFEPGSEYLYAYIESDIDSYEIALAYWQEIAGQLFERNLKRVLVHENILGELSDTDTFQLASELRSIGFSNVKIAILDNHAAHRRSTEFGVLVGTNRGLRAQSFDTADEAVTWLLKA